MKFANPSIFAQQYSFNKDGIVPEILPVARRKKQRAAAAEALEEAARLLDEELDEETIEIMRESLKDCYIVGRD